jgi:hypothetical protein
MPCYICDKDHRIKNGAWCQECLDEYEAIFHDKPFTPLVDGHHLAVNETRVYSAITGREQTKIRQKYYYHGLKYGMKFSCSAIPGGYEVVRIS